MSPIIRGSNDPPQDQRFNPYNGQSSYPQENQYNPQYGGQPPYQPPNQQYGDQPPYPPQYPPQYPPRMEQGFGRAERPAGTWQATGPQMNDMQAHRDVRYGLPNPIMQTVSVFKTQMSLFSKGKAVYFLPLLAILIPIVYNLLKDRLSLNGMAELNGNGLMGLLLFLFPLILGLFTSFLCASLMPSEINERTAYMNMALPMSRSSFCLGKYMAALVVTLGVFVFAFGMAIFTSSADYTFFDEAGLGQAFLSIILSVLVYTSFTFAMGCLLKRGATILSLLTLVGVLPGIQFYLFAKEYIDSTALSVFPNLLPDMTCLSLGSYITASPIGLMNLLTRSSAIGFNVSDFDMFLSSVFALIWTAAFLLIGIFAVSRREM